jgi:hypothetical protein
MKEKTIEQYCVALAKSLGVSSIKLNAVSNRGYPDRMFFMGLGFVWFVEFKKEGEKPRKNQREIFSFLDKDGYVIDVIDNVIDFKKKIIYLLRTVKEVKIEKHLKDSTCH